MNSVERALHIAHARYQREQQAGVSTAKANSTRFVEPTSDTWIAQHRTWRPEGYYRQHCSHDRTLWSVWSVCVTCKRSKKEADSNFILLLTGEVGVVTTTGFASKCTVLYRLGLGEIFSIVYPTHIPPIQHLAKALRPPYLLLLNFFFNNRYDKLSGTCL